MPGKLYGGRYNLSQAHGCHGDHEVLSCTIADSPSCILQAPSTIILEVSSANWDNLVSWGTEMVLKGKLILTQLGLPSQKRDKSGYVGSRKKLKHPGSKLYWKHSEVDVKLWANLLPSADLKLGGPPEVG